MKQIDFSRNLIKGKIAEVVFEQMIREEGKYTVIPFGYEHTVPTLAQYRDHAVVKLIMENIADAPDFALISNDKKQVYLVEVKYQSNLNIEQILKTAEKLHKRWKISWVFVATPRGFYCDTRNNISKTKQIKTLSASWVIKPRQLQYLKLLNDFEK